MLDQLSYAGLTGLTLWPEDLRHPFSYNADKPLLSPKDFAGLNIRTQASKLSYQLIKGMGGIPVLGDNEEGAESGLRQGAGLPGSPVATGNVTFFAKYQVLFGNRDAWEKLSEEQRAILMQAAMAVQKKAIAEHPSEVDAAKAWCASEGTIVITSDEQVAAFESDAQPVFDMIAQDPLNAELIAAIRELKVKTEPSPGVEACTT
jgi:TRAP-type C4-dicarboxylate transport system substrate-binding protein